jgi:hypothetical protein
MIAPVFFDEVRGTHSFCAQREVHGNGYNHTALIQAGLSFVER